MHRWFPLPECVLRVFQGDFFKYQLTYHSYHIIFYFSHGIFETMRVSCSFASLFSPRFPSPTLDGELHSNKNLVVMPDAWNSARHNIGSPYFLNNKWSAFHRGERLRPVRSLPRVSRESGRSGRRAANSLPEKRSSRSRSSRVPPPRPREDSAGAGQRIFLASTEYPGAAHVPPRAAPPHVRFPSPGVLSQSPPPLSSRSRSRG